MPHQAGCTLQHETHKALRGPLGTTVLARLDVQSVAGQPISRV